MLKKLNRLTTKFQFNIVKKYGTRISTDLFSVTTLRPRNYEGPTKVGFVVPNTITKKATKRNRIKRLLRESVRKHFTEFPNGQWLAFFVNHKILDKTYEEINSQVTKALQKISIAG